jgi:microcystin-dependent protein
MTDQFVGEIRMFPFNFAPRGWATCDGQLLSISQNTALFSLLGTFYGGDGKTTFALPNLQGSVPIHQGSGAGLTPRVIGETGGEQAVTLVVSEMPLHSHQISASIVAQDLPNPANNLWAPQSGRTPPNIYSSGPANTVMSPLVIGISGQSLPHNNMSPYLCVNFCIALQGIFPPRG